MKTLQDELQETFDLAIYLQIMGSVVKDIDFSKVKELILSTHDFVKQSSEDEVTAKLPSFKKKLEKTSAPLLKKFPIKKTISEIAANWNKLFKDGLEVYSYGIEYGWLEEHMDVKNLPPFYYLPYHTKMGLAAHKGYAGIEEEFLLKDAFNILVKAEDYYELLINFGNKIKDKQLDKNKNLEKEIYGQITDIKYEVAAFSRLTIISFYSFIECLVNSIGYSHLKRNQAQLTATEIETLNGLKKGRYLQLKSKIELFQKLIRKDKKAMIITSDANQMQEPFISFFNHYEELRNASVHYSPRKQQIWLKPKDWLESAQIFSKISIEAGLLIWKSCKETSTGPKYLGKLDYKFHHNLANERLKNVAIVRNLL